MEKCEGTVVRKESDEGKTGDEALVGGGCRGGGIVACGRNVALDGGRVGWGEGRSG